jgi:VHS domain
LGAGLEKPPWPSSNSSIQEIQMSLFLLQRYVKTTTLREGCVDETKLLDICVKNCGYPFHLQISTKEFLNELVRRFPERPPIRPSRVQSKILEAIEEWRQTICQTSRYKEDLGFIRDMHRLLLYKGYMFPEVRREDAAVLNPSDVRCLASVSIIADFCRI